MAPSTERSARNRLRAPDPDFYTELWGSRRRTCRAGAEIPRRSPFGSLSASTLRARAAVVGLTTSILLVAYLAISGLSF